MDKETDDTFVKPMFLPPKAVKSHKQQKSEIKDTPKDQSDVLSKSIEDGKVGEVKIETEVDLEGKSEDKMIVVKREEEQKKTVEEPIRLNYKEPKWSGSPSYPYTLEVLKGGQIVDEVDISEAAVVTVGRLPSCDLPCLHPSISRYHAILQHKASGGGGTGEDDPGGVFLYDLGSSYGTIINKVKIKPKTYYKLKTGYVVKFGASTRLYIVKGPPEEAFDDEKELTEKSDFKAGGDKDSHENLTKMGILAAEEAEQFLAMVKRREAEERGETEEKEKEGEDSGVSWGFREDAREEDDGSLKLDPLKMSKPAEFKDPKKTFRGFFEREGVELEYMVTETGQGRNHQYICRVELPIDTPAPVFAEGTSCGKKKDAVLACAVHGCRLLDAYGVLRRCRKNEAIETRIEAFKKNDYYDSDEDTFTDRTGEVEMKRKRRMLRAGVEERKVTTSRTYDMLTSDLEKMDKEIQELQEIIRKSKEVKEGVSGDGVDELDAYMATVDTTTVDSATLREAKKKLFDLKQERVKTQKLCELAKPVPLPEAKKLSKIPSNICTGRIGRDPSNKRKLLTSPSEHENKGSNEPLQLKINSNSKGDLETVRKSNANKIKIDLSKPKPSKDAASDSSKKGLGDVFETEEKPEPIRELYIPRRDDSDEEEEENPVVVSDKSAVVSDKSAVVSDKPGVVSDKPGVVTETDKTVTATTKRRRRKRRNSGNKVTPTLSENVKWDDDIQDENFVSWTPPTGQTGDGRTKLNDKYGY